MQLCFSLIKEKCFYLIKAKCTHANKWQWVISLPLVAEWAPPFLIQALLRSPSFSAATSISSYRMFDALVDIRCRLLRLDILGASHRLRRSSFAPPGSLTTTAVHPSSSAPFSASSTDTALVLSSSAPTLEPLLSHFNNHLDHPPNIITELTL